MSAATDCTAWIQALNTARTANTSDQNEVSLLHLVLPEATAEQELREPAGRTEAFADR